MNSIKRKVLILVSTTESFGQNLVRGIIDYARFCGNWSLSTEIPEYLRKRQKQKNYKKTLCKSDFDGVIAYLPDANEAQHISFKNIPAVVGHFTDETRRLKLPYLICDNFSIGRLAFDYFQNKGFKNFGFFGIDKLRWSVERCKALIKASREAGLNAVVYNQETKSSLDNADIINDIADWIKGLSKPIGILACNDDRGVYLIKACNLANIQIPNEVAIIGVDNDDILCNLTTPTLSSISYNSRKAGFEAAALLQKIMNDEKDCADRIIIPPIKVISRQSTDTLAIEDTDILAALRFIKKNSNRAIGVDDVAEAAGVSRRSLFRKFKKIMGHSVNQEINRNRIEHIKNILLTTNLAVTQIGGNLGFVSPSHLARYFKKQTGLTPRDYRKQNQTIL